VEEAKVKAGAADKPLPELGKKLKGDIEALEKSGRTVDSDKNLKGLLNWWESARPHADHDKQPVEEAGLYGGKMALTVTAAVPATMALGYLLLLFYFGSMV